MEISATAVKELREKTGLGMMLCKKALTESNGDMKLAIEALRKQGQATLAKRAGKAAKQGKVTIVSDAGAAIAFEVNSETDFVAKNEDFLGFISTIGKVVLEKKPADLESAKALPLAEFGGLTSEAKILELVAKIGENISFRRYKKETVAGVHEKLFTYTHGEGRIGVLVKLACANAEAAAAPAVADLGKDLAMQVAAANPIAIDRASINKLFAALVEKEKEIYFTQAQTSGKPEKVWPKIVEGKLEKFYKESALLEQPYIRDPDRPVSERIKDAEKAVSSPITVVSFTRFELGAEEYGPDSLKWTLV
ncbi:MAG TPA: translation elongation factor Ts [Chitinivibrionales bacterium]|nr:translation elongation factor Ts [Chitinivibrionales bacterium]